MAAVRRWAVNLALYVLGAGLLLLVLEPVRLAAIRLGSLVHGGGLAALAWPDMLKVVLGVVLAALTLMLSAALGVPVLSLLIYALLQWTHALFCHANVALAVPLDRMLRYCIVTPDMHRVHHSVRMDEGNRNFGMVLGLATKQGQGLWASLVQPLHGVSDAAAEEQILR